MPSFDDLKKNLSNKEKNNHNIGDDKSSKTAIIKISKKDPTLIEIEDNTLEDTIRAACSHFNTERENLRMKVKQKGSKGILGVGKKHYIVLFKFLEELAEEKNKPQEGKALYQVKRDGVYIRIKQGRNGGKIITEDYVSKLLVKNKINEYDRDKISTAINEKEGEWVKIGSTIKTNPDWNSKAKIDILDNGMKAVMVMTPPILNGRIIEKDDIMRQIKEKNIVFGVSEEDIEYAISECIYSKPIVIAEGKAPIDGKNAYMEFKFKIHPEKELELKEDQFGKIDYFSDVGLIQNVVEDQVLAQKVPPTKGIDGKKITGETIPAKDGEDIPLPIGKNTKASDNSLEVISMMQGQAIYEDELISVEPVYTVNGNVDLSTGKIVFLGTVIVKGDVEDGFGVKATQNVEIGGTIGRCEIEAEGNVLIKGGIQGKSTIGLHEREEEDSAPEKEPEGYVKAGKSVYAKFINGSIVKAEKDVIVSDAIYHSKVTAGERIVCLGRKGRIIGGELIASKEVNAKEIGSRNSYTKTKIEVGTDPEAKEKLTSMIKEQEDKENQIKELKKNIDQLNKLREQHKGTLPDDKEVLLRRSMTALDEHLSTVDELKDDIANLKAYLDEIKTNGKVSIKEYIYPGVQIYIKDINKKIDTENQFVTYILEAGEVRDIQYQEISKEIKEEINKEKESK